MSQDAAARFVYSSAASQVFAAAWTCSQAAQWSAAFSHLSGHPAAQLATLTLSDFPLEESHAIEESLRWISTKEGSMLRSSRELVEGWAWPFPNCCTRKATRLLRRPAVWHRKGYPPPPRCGVLSLHSVMGDSFFFILWTLLASMMWRIL